MDKYKLQYQQVGQHIDDCGDGAFAVAQQQVARREGTLPFNLFPALQANAQHPACLLSVRQPESVGEKLADAERHPHNFVTTAPGTDPRFSMNPEAHRKYPEYGLHTKLGETIADIVIFGQAVGVERQVGGVFTKRTQCAARKAGTDACRRHDPRDAFTHDHIFGMALCKFVHVGTSDQLVPFAFERRDR